MSEPSEIRLGITPGGRQLKQMQKYATSHGLTLEAVLQLALDRLFNSDLAEDFLTDDDVPEELI